MKEYLFQNHVLLERTTKIGSLFLYSESLQVQLGQKSKHTNYIYFNCTHLIVYNTLLQQ